MKAHYTTCAEDIEPDEKKRDKQFNIDNYQALSRCIAEKSGFIDANGLIDSTKRRGRGLHSDCIQWDDCWEAKKCDTYNGKIGH